jgi:hypothetical protein
MRPIAPPLIFCLAQLVTGLVYAEAAQSPPAKPGTIALVAAFGDLVSFVSQVQSTGSHLSSSRQATGRVKDDVLNRIVLHSLDSATAGILPDSNRIYLSLSAVSPAGVASLQDDTAAIEAIIAALEKMPQRQEWDRIVVATPAYRALERDGLAGRLQGFGLFSDPLCHGCGSFLDDVPSNVKHGSIDAVTSEGDAIKSQTYVAPFSYIDIWILDPKTLAILDKQERFESQKLAEPQYKPVSINVEQYLMRRLASLIDHSISDAVTHSELNTRQGKVEVSNPIKVDPEPNGK